MGELPISIPIVIAALTVFLSTAVGLSYGIRNNFVRTRLVMTLFFCFIVFTLSVSFWPTKMATFPYAVPSAIFGMIIGYIVGVRAAEKRLRTEGIEYYMEHFAHVHFHEVKQLNWWSLVNFYSVMGGLLMINLIGLSNVIYEGAQLGAILTSIVGAFLLGTIVPYLIHLWSIKPMKFR